MTTPEKFFDTVPARFDREQDLGALLPADTAERLCRNVEALFFVQCSFLGPDGALHAGGANPPPSMKPQGGRAFPSGGFRKPVRMKTSDGLLMLHPLLHENEVIGYLCLGPETGGTKKRPGAFRLIQFLSDVAGDLIRGRYACLMTSELHSEVVETSYAELRKKNERLKASEKKYRDLAQDLERQVMEKTREIQEAQIRLMEQEKLASIGQLAAGVAHEINNPIGFVQSNLNTLSEYAADLLGLLDDVDEGLAKLEHTAPDDLQESCRTLCRDIAGAKDAMDYAFVHEDTAKVIRDSLQGTGRIADIVNDLKAFAHLDKAEREPADLNRGIRSTLNILRNELRDGIEVVEDLAPLPDVMCHPQHLNQVFLNLLRNAIQALAEHGRIHITTRFEEGHVRICIRDTGTGIPERHLKRVFDPFFTTRPVGQGTGLGLNVAYNILRAHGGTIGVESEEGAGTVFTLRIPVTGGPPESDRETGEKPPCRD